MMLNWYLNLPFLEAVLVWLKLLLPVLFLLVVAMLFNWTWNWFGNGTKLRPPEPAAPNRPRKEHTSGTAVK